MKPNHKPYSEAIKLKQDIIPIIPKVVFTTLLFGVCYGISGVLSKGYHETLIIGLGLLLTISFLFRRHRLANFPFMFLVSNLCVLTIIIIGHSLALLQSDTENNNYLLSKNNDITENEDLTVSDDNSKKGDLNPYFYELQLEKNKVEFSEVGDSNINNNISGLSQIWVTISSIWVWLIQATILVVCGLLGAVISTVSTLNSKED
jgi:hypothetical protein